MPKSPPVYGSSSNNNKQHKNNNKSASNGTAKKKKKHNTQYLSEMECKKNASFKQPVNKKREKEINELCTRKETTTAHKTIDDRKLI